ncbi:MAG TPA: hypothetical protein VE196_07330 [Pseudonocardiaceae bacterium]|nr:hypothetical protein [Pseudonocardiaceae bacterium]
MKLVARAHQSVVWERIGHLPRLLSALLESRRGRGFRGLVG